MSCSNLDCPICRPFGMVEWGMVAAWSMRLNDDEGIGGIKQFGYLSPFNYNYQAKINKKKIIDRPGFIRRMINFCKINTEPANDLEPTKINDHGTTVKIDSKRSSDGEDRLPDDHDYSDRSSTLITNGQDRKPLDHLPSIRERSNLPADYPEDL